MIVKLIRCKVRPENRRAFSAAQEAWGRLANAPGFAGQWGGWCANEPDQAVILGAWLSLQDYEHFMVDLHDEIFAGSNQRTAYESIGTWLFEVLRPLGPRVDFQDGRLIRIIDFQVLEAGSAFSERTASGAWDSVMSHAEGIIGGYFGRYLGNPARFLVTTFWTGETTSQGYLDERLPVLLDRARPDQDRLNFADDLIVMAPEWSVIPMAYGRGSKPEPRGQPTT